MFTECVPNPVSRILIQVPQDATLFLATCRALSVKKWLRKGFGPGDIGHLKAITNPICCTGMYDESATCVDMKLTY
jgi:uncharacterized protein (DUF3820 family)